jgi:outer membrane protein OmpA-like peptidoglycan-associated protein
MAKHSCKCKETECEECPEWIFTLADLIMCMMGLFVILWVLKPSPQPIKAGTGPGNEELNRMIGAIREAFGYVPDPNSNDPVDIQLLFEKIKKLKINGPGEKGRAIHESQGAEGPEPEVTTIRIGKQAVVGGRVLFEKADAALDRRSMAMLDQIVFVIRGHRQVVLVKGHTSLDDLPENATPEQKMALSVRRAQQAADYLISKGVSPDILRVEGCSTFEPVLQRAYTADSRAQNRRVEVEATATLVEQLQDHPAIAPTTVSAPLAGESNP